MFIIHLRFYPHSDSLLVQVGRQCKVIDEQDEDEVLNLTQLPLRISKADEEGHEGLTQFLLLEVRKLRDQLRNSRMCERQLSQRCRVAEDERNRVERKNQELRQEHSQLERLRQDCEAGTRELGRLKERLLEQAVKYSRALEEQRNASTRERELLSQALLDILHQDQREAAEQRKELCSTIIRLQGELESAESVREKLETQCEQLQLKLRTLQLDWEEEQKKSLSYFNQIMDLERERDQALRSRDSLQLEFTDCLLDKNRLRKCITELQSRVEQLHRELEREKDKNHEQEHTHSQCCSHGVT
ncbi:hypothetical protein AMELA_G00176890 [Ameiurus melas]|uniref:Uncharacterized protein n=1 Tax=Ameiurus melas TaxID=219545 RepID=A0A7J6AD85_AMEME|nr:hypothetical protein AMELA_G00176890 [Ameiurus melas]